MATAKGTQLAEAVRQKIGELKKACVTIDEQRASHAPTGRWSAKEILSHLLGPGGSAHLHLFQLFLDRETPTIDIDPGNPFFTRERAQMPFTDLLSEVEKEYNRIAAFSEDLTEEQFARNARIPQLKESPLGEYPSLEALINGLGVFHMQMHIDQLLEILQEPEG